MDPTVFRAVMVNHEALAAKVPKTGKKGFPGIFNVMGWLCDHPKELEELKAEGLRLQQESSMSDSVLDSYDYGKLVQGSETANDAVWELQMETMLFVEKDGRRMNSDSKEALTTPGVLPVFQMYIYDEHAMMRFVEECVGLPDSDTVLRTIQKAIANPFAPLTPALPSSLFICRKLAHHASALSPFLNGLPPPFSWTVESDSEAQDLADIVYERHRKAFASGLQDAERLKAEGKKAYENNLRPDAIESYTSAIECLKTVFSRNLDNNEESTAMRQLAILHANLAATYLLPGEGQEPVTAFRYGRNAERYDPSYPKGYARQVQACKIQGGKALDIAKDVLARALRRDDLKDNSALSEMLIMLYTDEKGLPGDEAAFRKWYDTLLNDETSRKRLEGLEGMWRKKINEQLTRFTEK